MLPLYETLIADSVLDADRALLDSMRSKLEDELKKLDEKSVTFLFPLHVCAQKQCDWIWSCFECYLVLVFNRNKVECDHKLTWKTRIKMSMI